MAFEVKITPEDVDALVRETILKSGIGKVVEAAITNALSMRGYDSPIDKEVKRYVGEVCATLIREKYADQVKAAVAAAVEATVTTDLINATVSKATERLVKAAEEDKYR